jgi:hypothetical protein
MHNLNDLSMQWVPARIRPIDYLIGSSTRKEPPLELAHRFAGHFRCPGNRIDPRGEELSLRKHVLIVPVTPTESSPSLNYIMILAELTVVILDIRVE